MSSRRCAPNNSVEHSKAKKDVDLYAAEPVTGSAAHKSLINVYSYRLLIDRGVSIWYNQDTDTPVSINRER